MNETETPSKTVVNTIFVVVSGLLFTIRNEHLCTYQWNRYCAYTYLCNCMYVQCTASFKCRITPSHTKTKQRPSFYTPLHLLSGLAFVAGGFFLFPFYCFLFPFYRCCFHRQGVRLSWFIQLSDESSISAIPMYPCAGEMDYD